MSAKNVKLFIFLLTLFVINSLNTNKSQAKLTQANNGVINLAVDDIINSVTVNGVSLPLPPRSSEWNVGKTINTNLRPGDQIAIKGTNTGGPAGMMATISYVDEKGNAATLNSGSNWQCDGKAPIIQGPNSSSSPKWPVFYSNISADAQWIWNPDFPASSTCTVTIPLALITSPTPSNQNNGVITLTVDNVINSVTVNGVSVPLPPKSDDWTATKTITTPLIPGDVIAVTGTNQGAHSQGNPASIIATITYNDENGKTVSLNTDGKWTCDGTPAALLGANSENTIWKRVKGSSISDVSPDAQWIWNTDNRPTSTCSVTIPKLIKENPGVINLTVDDIINSVTVNGVSLPLPPRSSEWNVGKTINTNLQPGDQIVISGTNTGGPAGLLATISYTDVNGNPATLNTDSTWQCDGKAPIVQGPNSSSSPKWPVFYSNISEEAQWIWNPDFPSSSTCTVTIPSVIKTSPVLKDGVITLTVDNVINSITVNGVSVPLPPKSDDWTATKTATTPLGPGDVIAITGTNQGAHSQGNPASIIATITYTDKNGKTVSLNTDGKWTCDGTPAALLGANSENTIWKSVKGSSISDVSPDAQWIWNTDNRPTSTCSVTIPKGHLRKCDQ